MPSLCGAVRIARQWIWKIAMWKRRHRSHTMPYGAAWHRTAPCGTVWNRVASARNGTHRITCERTHSQLLSKYLLDTLTSLILYYTVKDACFWTTNLKTIPNSPWNSVITRCFSVLLDGTLLQSYKIDAYVLRELWNDTDRHIRFELILLCELRFFMILAGILCRIAGIL